jgi:hypothetical protein
MNLSFQYPLDAKDRSFYKCSSAPEFTPLLFTIILISSSSAAKRVVLHLQDDDRVEFVENDID